MNRIVNVPLCGAVVLALTACGGGGGDGSTAISPVAGPVAITTDSAPTVSGAVVNATVGLQDISDFVGAGTIGTSASQHKTAALSTYAQVQAEFNDTVACTSGGSFSVSAQLQDPATLTVGDSIASTFASCSEFGTVLDGAFSFVIDRLVGTANDILRGRFALGASVIVNNFSITFDGETTTANGDFQFDIDTTAFDISLLELSGNVFSIDDATDTLTMSNFAVESTDETSSGAYTLKSSGTVDSAALQGSVSYVTVQTFVGFGDDFPYAGELQITGAGGSTINLIAVSSADVRLEIDSDGDGAVDDIVDTTWADITG